MSELGNLQIAEIRELYGLRSFVETGCHMGNGIEAALNAGFRDCFSCDLLERFVKESQERFSKDPDVRIWHTDSLTFLLDLPEDIGPTLYWLDAHQPWSYDNAVADTPETKFPIMRELEIIRARKNYHRDVIMIDDLIVIQGSPRWHENEVCDYFQIKDIDFNALLQSMAATHQALINLGQEGILTFLPGYPRRKRD